LTNVTIGLRKYEMGIEIRQLQKKDFSEARKFAIEGMHLNWYVDAPFGLYWYSKYFWSLEISRASIALGAYDDNKLVGVLLADINNEKKLFNSIKHRIMISIAEFIINCFAKNASDEYHNANKKMLIDFNEKNNPDGEINYFAVNPQIKGQGIGTLLLNRFEEMTKGKLIYLYTDSGSTYQFYYHRGFVESGKRDIKMIISKKEVDLTCFLFSKRI